MHPGAPEELPQLRGRDHAWLPISESGAPQATCRIESWTGLGGPGGLPLHAQPAVYWQPSYACKSATSKYRVLGPIMPHTVASSMTEAAEKRMRIEVTLAWLHMLSLRSISPATLPTKFTCVQRDVLGEARSAARSFMCQARGPLTQWPNCGIICWALKSQALLLQLSALDQYRSLSPVIRSTRISCGYHAALTLFLARLLSHM